MLQDPVLVEPRWVFQFAQVSCAGAACVGWFQGGMCTCGDFACGRLSVLPAIIPLGADRVSCGESVSKIRRPAQRICVKCSFTQAASSSVVCTFQAGESPHCWHSQGFVTVLFPPGSVFIACAVQLMGRLQPCHTVSTESLVVCVAFGCHACVGRGYSRLGACAAVTGNVCWYCFLGCA
jgi:hypothetical protein